MRQLERLVVHVVVVIGAYNGFFGPNFGDQGQTCGPIGAPVLLRLLGAADLPWPRSESISLGTCPRDTVAMVDLHGGRVAILVLYFVVICAAIHIAAVSTAVFERCSLAIIVRCGCCPCCGRDFLLHCGDSCVVF